MHRKIKLAPKVIAALRARAATLDRAQELFQVALETALLEQKPAAAFFVGFDGDAVVVDVPGKPRKAPAAPEQP